MKITPVILSGGTGSRLWPSSREIYPKQLQQLLSEKTMLQETVLRFSGMENITDPIVICNNDHRFIISEQLKKIGVSSATVILEPEGKNTAPAALLSALYAKQQNLDTVLVILPADHHIKNKLQFHKTICDAADLAMKNYLVTFGVEPSSPETGYGYIRKGDLISRNAFHLSEFIEKPDLKTAEGYLKSNQYLWNSGMFVFKPQNYIDEVKQFEPMMFDACFSSLKKAKVDIDFVRIDAQSFRRCPENSIDYAVMEKTRRAAVIPFTSYWSDVGSWSSLWESLPKDSHNNVLKGDVLTTNVKNSYISSQDRLVAAVGVKDHVIVETPDAVLVAHKQYAQEVKSIVSKLKSQKRSEYQVHQKVYRPWGSYQTIDLGERFQVKRITVKCGARLSLQMHYHRAEHWIVVKGTATVTCGDKTFTLNENQSTYIPIEYKHRLENHSNQVLEIIEVQSGSYLGEDDIVRFEDDYQRVEA